VAEWLALWLVAQEVKGSTLIATAPKLPSEAWRFEKLTTVISVTYGENVYLPWCYPGQLSLPSLQGR